MPASQFPVVEYFQDIFHEVIHLVFAEPDFLDNLALDLRPTIIAHPVQHRPQMLCHLQNGHQSQRGIFGIELIMLKTDRLADEIG